MSKRRKLGIGAGVVLALLVIGSLSHHRQPAGGLPAATIPTFTAATDASPSYSPAPLPTYTYDPVPTYEAPATVQYVPPADDSPAPASPMDVPNVGVPGIPDVVPGDTALCNDGHIYHGGHRGACSHHHGVAHWL